MHDIKGNDGIMKIEIVPQPFTHKLTAFLVYCCPLLLLYYFFEIFPNHFARIYHDHFLTIQSLIVNVFLYYHKQQIFYEIKHLKIIQAIMGPHENQIKKSNQKPSFIQLLEVIENTSINLSYFLTSYYLLSKKLITIQKKKIISTINN